jgi:hypothetical protein
VREPINRPREIVTDYKPLIFVGGGSSLRCVGLEDIGIGNSVMPGTPGGTRAAAGGTGQWLQSGGNGQGRQQGWK